MNSTKKILITYASWMGTTKEIAGFIAQNLVEQKYDVMIAPLLNVESLKQFDTIIIGTSIREGKPHPDISLFINRFRNDLRSKTIVLFVVYFTMKSDTRKNRQKVMNYISPLLLDLGEQKPMDIGLFAGSFNPYTFPNAFRLLVRSSHIKEGDFRDWEKIKKWTLHLIQKLT